MKKMNILRCITLLLSLFVAVTGLLILASWIWNIPILNSFFPGLMTVKANTATTIFLCGTSLALLSRKINGRFIRFGVVIGSILIILIGASSITEDILSIDIPIDDIMYKYITGITDLSNPGLISSPTAFCVLMIGFALLMAAQSSSFYLKEPCVIALGVTITFICGLAIFSNLLTMFGIRFWNYAGVEVYAAIIYMLIGIALLTLIFSEDNFNWSLNSFMTVGFLMGILTILTTGILSYHYTNQLRQDDEQVPHTQEAIKKLNNIKDALASLEISQRDYIMTGDKKLLKNQLQNKLVAQKNMGDFYHLIDHDTYQRNDFNQLKVLIVQKNNLVDQTIAVRQQLGFLHAQKVLVSEQGIALSEKINQLLVDMLNEEYDLLDHRERIENAIFIKAFTLLPLGIFTSLTLLILGLFIFNAGINERKKMGASRIQLSAIVESSNDAIIGKDLNGVITSWNTAAEHMFGYGAEEIIGHPMSYLIPADRQQEEEIILNKIRHGEKIEHFETVRKRKDGQFIDISATISPIKDADGEIIGASKIVRDITEKKQLEQQLRQSQKMEAIGQLTGGIAHDFNNLLGVIIGNLELLERMLTGNEEAIKRAQTTLKAATRGADLTKRLLAFSRLQQLDPTPISLEESIHNMIEMATRTFGPDIEIVTHLDKSIPPILVDASGLENTLLNLAVNARDAMSKGGLITISTQLKNLGNDYVPVQTGEIKSGVYACISVTDMGHGMSRDTMERAFEPFFTTKPRGKGTGLGLSMVYGFIKQSGGIVRIYSEVDHGTTVSFYLPLAKDIPLPIDYTIQIEQPKMSGTVLVVDDEVDLLEIAATYLKEMGYDVFQATDATSALAIVERENHLDLLVTDVIMPGINGVELAKKVRQQKKDIVVVYLSGFPSGALTERNGTKIDGPLINKPYHREEFTTAIHQAIKNHHTNPLKD